MLNIIKRKQLLAHVKTAAFLLAAVQTGLELCVEAGTVLQPDELLSFQVYWQQQLSNALAQIDSARRITETSFVDKKDE